VVSHSKLLQAIGFAAKRKTKFEQGIEILLTKEAIESLIQDEIKWYKIEGTEVPLTEMQFAGYPVHLGSHNSVRIVEEVIRL
jgi:hypothetical protein